MRIVHFSVGIALAAVLSAPPVYAKEEVVKLQPSSPWAMRYDEDKCRLTRSFGEGTQKTFLHIDQSGIEPFYTLSVLGEPFEPTRSQIMAIQFGPVEGVSERSFIGGDSKGDEPPFIVMFGIHLAPVPESVEPGVYASVELGEEREAAISWIRFEKGVRDPVVLHTGSMGEPLSAMHACSKDFAKFHGLDEAGQSKIEKLPQPKNLRNIAKKIPYPTRMLDAKADGDVLFTVTVDKEGKPTSCQIAKSNRPEVFDDVVCFSILREMKFEPAQDSDGNPVMGRFSTTVKFRVD